jgi:hypothetical protein
MSTTFINRSNLYAISDGGVAKVRRSHIEPGIPAAHVKGVVEDGAEAVVDDVTDADVDVLGPELAHAGPSVRPHAVVAPQVLRLRRLPSQACRGGGSKEISFTHKFLRVS